MSLRTPDQDTDMPRSFVVHWMLSLVGPAVLFMLLMFAVIDFFRSSHVLLLWLFLFWLAAGHTQSQLLIRRLPRRRLWMIVSCAGGGLGSIAGPLAKDWVFIGIMLALDSTSVPSALREYGATLAAMGAAGAVAGGMLGFLQSTCLDGSVARRALWFLASTAYGCLAVGTASIAEDVLLWLTSAGAQDY